MAKLFIVTIAAITATTYVQTIGKKTARTLEEVVAFLDEYSKAWHKNYMPPPTAADIEQEFTRQHAQNEVLPGTRECRFTITFTPPQYHEGLAIEHNITIVEHGAGFLVPEGGPADG